MSFIYLSRMSWPSGSQRLSWMRESTASRWSSSKMISRSVRDRHSGVRATREKPRERGRGLKFLGCRPDSASIQKICCWRGCPQGVGHGLQIPDDDGWFHEGRISPGLRSGKPLAVWKLQNRYASLSSCQLAACPLVQAREAGTSIIVIDIRAVLNRADAINNLSGLIEFKR